MTFARPAATAAVHRHHGWSLWQATATDQPRNPHAARQIKAHAPHCRVFFTVYEMKRLGRDSAELTALADHLTAHGIALEMLAGSLTGIYDPTGTGRVLFAFFAAMAETERENIREATLEGLNADARKGNHGGRPPVITDDILHTVLRRRANGESLEDIRPDLIIPTGKRKGRNPSLASIYRALTQHEKRQATPKPLTRPTPTLPRSSQAPAAAEQPGYHRPAISARFSASITATPNAPKGNSSPAWRASAAKLRTESPATIAAGSKTKASKQKAHRPPTTDRPNTTKSSLNHWSRAARMKPRSVGDSSRHAARVHTPAQQ